MLKHVKAVFGKYWQCSRSKTSLSEVDPAQACEWVTVAHGVRRNLDIVTPNVFVIYTLLMYTLFVSPKRLIQKQLPRNECVTTPKTFELWNKQQLKKGSTPVVWKELLFWGYTCHGTDLIPGDRYLLLWLGYLDGLKVLACPKESTPY